jgi:membrane-bound serine protease (ClpP class)
MDPFALNLIMIICFIAGSALIIAEAFMPGFGVAGISGLVLELTALWATWQLHGLRTALLALLGVIVLTGLVVFFSYRSAKNGRLSRSPLVLKETESAGKTSDLSGWIGQAGVAVTALRPGGEVEIGGRRLNAASTGELIPKGTRVTVTGAEGAALIVRPE